MIEQPIEHFTFRNEDEKVKYIKSGKHKMAMIRKGWDTEDSIKKAT